MLPECITVISCIIYTECILLLTLKNQNNNICVPFLIEIAKRLAKHTKVHGKHMLHTCVLQRIYFYLNFHDVNLWVDPDYYIVMFVTYADTPVIL